MKKRSEIEYQFYSCDRKAVMEEIGKEKLLAYFKQMLLIRNFELRAESAYQQGKVGGFFHAYMGQEAIQIAAVATIGIPNNWWITTYRCHALAILMGENINSLMAELYGKENGNAMGRGGSMHLYSERMLGGFGIVGGHLPIAAGAAFSLKYQKQDGVATCFLGDGAFVQGAVHESLNLMSLWDLPSIIVIENNQWGMGTGIERALCNLPIAESFAAGYRMESYTLDGMDLISCYAAFKEVHQKVLQDSRPILMETVTERFRGHSISDPALYRSKEELKHVMEKDPIIRLKKDLIAAKMLTEEQFEAMNKEQKELVIASMKYAEESPDPELTSLEEDVFAP